MDDFPIKTFSAGIAILDSPCGYHITIRHHDVIHVTGECRLSFEEEMQAGSLGGGTNRGQFSINFHRLFVGSTLAVTVLCWQVHF